MTQQASDVIAGRNAVSEALRGQRSINKILIQEGARGGSLGELVAAAKNKGVPVEIVKSERLDKLAPGLRHQGVVALAAPIAFQSLDDVFAKAAAKDEPPFLLLLDELQDPQNVGALLRTADAAGVHAAPPQLSVKCGGSKNFCRSGGICAGGANRQYCPGYRRIEAAGLLGCRR